MYIQYYVMSLSRGLAPQQNRDPAPDPPTSPTTPQHDEGERPSEVKSRQISDGSLVSLKNGAPCGPNAIVFTSSPKYGPQVGRTTSVIESSAIDPKTSVLVKVYRDRLASLSSQSNFDWATRQNFHGSSNDIYSGLEVWKLSDVVFLDDSPSILGRVVVVDGHQVVVDCSYTESQSDLGEGTSSSTTAAMKSSLKVFRLNDLEPCLEGPDFLTAPMQGSSLSDGPSASSSQPTPRVISRHVAGVVQHRPVCIIDSLSSHHLSISLQNLGSSVSEPIPRFQAAPSMRGFRTLAAHCTDSGPVLLVERVSDHSSFLVSSAHLPMSGVIGTSFVAVGNHDSKQKRSTVVEESVISTESGLTCNRSVLRAVKSLSNQFKTGFDTRECGKAVTTKSEAATMAAGKTIGKNKAPSKKGKGVSSASRRGSNSRGKLSAKHTHLQHDKVAMDTDTVSMTFSLNSVPKSVPSCEFIPLLADQPDLCFLRDASGTVWPLMDGLSLLPTPPGGPNGATSCQKRPLESYRCVCLRQYAVQGQDIDSIAVFVLGKCLCLHMYIYTYMYVRTYYKHVTV